MTWVKVDDQFQDHPKFIDVSLAGVGLWVAGLAYCSRYLTDGFVAVGAAKRLGATKKLTDELTHAGLWRVVDGGWLVHGYTDYNPTAKEVRDRRAKQAKAGRLGGLARAGNMHSNGQAESKQIAKHGAKAPASPRPVPSPIHLSSETTSPPPNGRCFEEEDSGTVGNEALRLIVNRRLAKRDPRLEPIKSVRRWREATATDVLLEHGDQLLDLIGKGLDAETVADTIEPSAPLTLVQPLDPPCRRCHGLRHPPGDEHLLPLSEQDVNEEAM